MKVIAMTVGALAAFAAAPAFADTAAPAATPTAALGALLSDGYEVKSVLDVSADEQKAIWPNDATEPYVMITLQKGASVAVCGLQLVNWYTLNAATLSNATVCRQR